MIRSKQTMRVVTRLFRNWPAKALSLAAAVLLSYIVGLNQLEERYLSIPIDVSFPADLTASREYPLYSRVMLRGDADDIFAITEDEIRIEADFTPFTAPGEYRVALVGKTQGLAAELDSLELTIEPGMMTVELEERLTAVLDIIPQMTGTPAAGYELGSYSVEPDTVTVYGPRSALDGVGSISTEAIDLNGATQNIESRIALVQPHPLVKFSGASVVDFRAEISESILVSTFEDVPVTILGLDSRFITELENLTGSIRAQASQSLIERTSSDSISLVVDAADITEAGTYTLSVRPQMPRGFVIFRFDPLEVVLEVEEISE